MGRDGLVHRGRHQSLFGSLDHEVLLSALAEKIHDNRFLRLLRRMLAAGYLEDWTWNATLSGTPQGRVASPILSNIYLHRLDTFVETVLIPQYTRGERRVRNPAYQEVFNALQRARRRGDRATARALRHRLQALPSSDPRDPGYRRLRYVRYADDHLLGFAGPKAEAEQIKQQLATFLREDLALELSPDKTLITHARSGAARFLGYDITVQHDSRQLTHGRRYGAEYRGTIQYYLLANNIRVLHRLRWAAEVSLLKTLASKHRSTVMRMSRKYRAKIDTSVGPRR